MVNNYYTLVRSGVMPLWRVPTLFIDGVITLARDDVKHGSMSRETFVRITGMEYEPVKTKEVQKAIKAIQEPIKAEAAEDEAEKTTTKRKRKKKADTDEEAEPAKEDKED